MAEHLRETPGAKREDLFITSKVYASLEDPVQVRPAATVPPPPPPSATQCQRRAVKVRVLVKVATLRPNGCCP